MPEFHVSQNVERREVLDLIAQRMACGRIQANHRRSNDTSMVFVVRNREDLLTRVIPFFEQQPLISSKRREFDTFARIVRAMRDGIHLTLEGFDSLATEALSMNGGGKYRKLTRAAWHTESSETICRTSGQTAQMKIWSDLHGDMQS